MKIRKRTFNKMKQLSGNIFLIDEEAFQVNLV